MYKAASLGCAESVYWHAQSSTLAEEIKQAYIESFSQQSPETTLALIHGATVDILNDPDLLLMHECAKSDCVQCCYDLISHGAMTDIKDEFGRTPAEYASSVKMYKLFCR